VARFTPRQRCALAHPCFEYGDVVIHPRHYRVTVPFQSILTFDLHQPPADFELDGLELIDGWLGMWHARVTKYPESNIDTWEVSERKRARLIAKRLCAGTGREPPEVLESGDRMAYRVFTWATNEELRIALKALQKEKGTADDSTDNDS
jgi:hypothetical protein